MNRSAPTKKNTKQKSTSKITSKKSKKTTPIKQTKRKIVTKNKSTQLSTSNTYHNVSLDLNDNISTVNQFTPSTQTTLSTQSRHISTQIQSFDHSNPLTKPFNRAKRTTFKSTFPQFTSQSTPPPPTTTTTTPPVPVASDTTTKATDVTKSADGTEAPKESKLKQLYTKYGKLAVYTYFGVYFATLAGLTVGVNLMPGFDAQVVIQWIKDGHHLDTQIGWFESAMDKYPAIGTPIRTYPKQFANFGAAWCLTKVTEPVRALATVAITKYIGEKREKEKLALEANKTNGV